LVGTAAGGVEASVGGEAGRLGDAEEFLSLMRAFVNLLRDLDTRLGSWLVGWFGWGMLGSAVGIVGVHVA
jgi:hypothetical protein